MLPFCKTSTFIVYHYYSVYRKVPMIDALFTIFNFHKWKYQLCTIIDLLHSHYYSVTKNRPKVSSRWNDTQPDWLYLDLNVMIELAVSFSKGIIKVSTESFAWPLIALIGAFISVYKIQFHAWSQFIRLNYFTLPWKAPGACFERKFVVSNGSCGFPSNGKLRSI